MIHKLPIDDNLDIAKFLKNAHKCENYLIYTGSAKRGIILRGLFLYQGELYVKFTNQSYGLIKSLLGNVDKGVIDCYDIANENEIVTIPFDCNYIMSYILK